MAITDKKKRPQDDPAYQTGTALRGAGMALNETAAGVLGAIQRPGQVVANAIEDAGRGFFGAAPRAVAPAAPIAPAQVAPLPSPPVATANAAPIPSTAVQGGAIPARNPVSPGASAGAAAPAGGVPAPTPIALKPGDVNTYTGTNGVTRPVPGLLDASRSPAPASAPLPMPTTLGPAPTAPPAPAPNAPVADPFKVRQAVEKADKTRGAIDDAAWRAGLRAKHSTSGGSAQHAQAGILGTLAQFGANQLETEIGVATGNRDAAGANQRTGMEQAGATQRTSMQESGANQRTDAQERGATERAGIERPTSFTDANGNLLRVTGGQAQPIVGPDGKPVKAPQGAQAGVITPAMQFEQDSKTYQTLLANPPPLGDDVGAAAYQQQLAQLQQKLAGYGNPSAGQATSGMTLVGTTKDGKKVYRDASGKTFSE